MYYYFGVRWLTDWRLRYLFSILNEFPGLGQSL